MRSSLLLLLLALPSSAEAADLTGHWDEYKEYQIAREQEALYGADAPFAMAA